MSVFKSPGEWGQRIFVREEIFGTYVKSLRIG